MAVDKQYNVTIDLTRINDSIQVSGVAVSITQVTSIGLLAGPPGPQGPQGDQGIPGPPGDPGMDLVQSVNGHQGVVVVTKSDVGLGQADDTSDLDKPVSTAQQTALDGKQNLDDDLTAISTLLPTNDDVLQRKAGTWVNRTIAQFKDDLAYTKSDVGLGNVDNTSDANKPVSTATQTALDGKQPIDSDLTTFAGLTPTNDDVLQRKAGAWINRSMSQLKTDLALTKSDVGLSNVDNTSDATKNAASATLTNKSIDADSNTLTNIIVANLKASIVVTESEGLGSSDNDTSLPTTAAVKDYVDTAAAALDAIRTSTIGLANSNANYECGATDHDVTFQTAIDDMETAIGLTGYKQRLVIMPGVYDQIEQVITIQPKYADKIYIEGTERVTLKKTGTAGGGSKIFGESAPTYDTTPGSDWLDFAYRGNLGFHLRNVTLDGNGPNNSSGSPISLNGCQDFNLVDVTIYDGKEFQSYVKGAKGVQIFETDDVTEATVTAVKGSNFISASNVDFTDYVTVGDKLRVATTATPDNTGGSDADYSFDSADVIEVTSTRLQLAAPWPHQNVSGRQVRFFKPNEVNSTNLHYENRTGFTGVDDSWGGGAFNGHLFNITVVNSGGYAIGMTGSGGFLVDGIHIYGGVKGVGTERCYGRTRISNFSINGCSSAGLWTINGNHRIVFSNGTITDCDGNGIDEKVVTVASDGSTIKAGNIGVVYQNVLVINSGVHGARITGDRTELVNVKTLNNGRISTGGGITLASDTNGSQTTNATNVRLINCEGFDTRSSTDRTQNYGLWIVSGAGADLYTHNVSFYNNTTSNVNDASGGPRIINFQYDNTNNRMSMGELWADAKIHNVTDPTAAQDAATKTYVDSGASLYRPGGTDVAVADGGTGSSTASGARTNLGLAIGTDVQAYDPDLTSWASKTAPSGTAVGTSDTQTLTNKRINPRIGTVASSATPSINVDDVDQFNITALAAAITSMTTNLSGTPVDGQKLLVRIKDNGTARAITHGASFVSSGSASLLTTTVINKTHLELFIYDSVAAVWVCMASDPVGY